MTSYERECAERCKEGCGKGLVPVGGRHYAGSGQLGDIREALSVSLRGHEKMNQIQAELGEEEI